MPSARAACSSTRQVWVKRDGSSPEHGAGQDVASSAVGAGAVQVGQHSGGRPGEQLGQGQDRLWRQVRGGAAEAAVIDQEGRGQHSSVSTGRKSTCLPRETGRRASSIRNCSRAWLAVSSR
jgi:hypothetical protein